MVYVFTSYGAVSIDLSKGLTDESAVTKIGGYMPKNEL